VRTDSGVVRKRFELPIRIALVSTSNPAELRVAIGENHYRKAAL
jgi:hypothetical protein